MEAKDAGATSAPLKQEGGAFKGGGEDADDSRGSGPAGGGAEAKDSSDGRDAVAADYQSNGDYDVKIILLGDSAVGKSKLVERYLMDDYNPTQLSTYALNTFRKRTAVDGKPCDVEFWDTAGQERFQKVHPAYYDGASACILVFDVTRKATYQHLDTWFGEMREAAGKIPCICVANKIDMNYKVRRVRASMLFPEAKQAYGYCQYAYEPASGGRGGGGHWEVTLGHTVNTRSPRLRLLLFMIVCISPHANLLPLLGEINPR
jgi:small GTP-binding protein